MSRQPAGHRIEDLTVVSRRVLLDALKALRDHAEGVVVVGAQAIHLRAELAEREALASFTSDADLAIDRRGLSATPLLEDAMVAAGFQLAVTPGTWSRLEPVGDGSAEVAVDLLIPEAFSGTARKTARGGRIPPHATTATRRVRGLEAALVDHDVLAVRSLDPEAPASTAARVAGVAALLVAKAYKIADRLADPRPGRLQDKDAADVVRLMQLGEPRAVAGRLELLLADPDMTDVVREGLDLLRSQFGRRAAPGTRMAVTALAGGTSANLVEAIGPAFLRRLPSG